MAVDPALMAARLFAVDPAGLGGVLLQGPAGDARDAWLRSARALMAPEAPWRRLPAHIADDRLLGGLDLAATLAAGHPVSRRGALAEADGGVVLLAMAERVEPGIAARIAAAMDAGVVPAPRGGADGAHAARIAVIALDDRCTEDEHVPATLAERLALHVRLPIAPASATRDDPAPSRIDIDAARALMPRVRAEDDVVAALCEAAQALGIDSLRACCLALKVARAAAALRGSTEVAAEDVDWAGRFVLGPRARAWPAAGEPAEASAPPSGDDANDAHEPSGPATQPSEPAAGERDRPPVVDARAVLEEAIVSAAAAALPPALLAAIATAVAMDGRQHVTVRIGPSGRTCAARGHGRPIGARRGELRGGARLDLLQTLRAAAPWQSLRRQARAGTGRARPAGRRRTGSPPILLQRDDFHIRRQLPRQESTTIFAVDASGSQALHRLAEAKGAVELMLAECYVRRDRVAVLAFRGESASVLLPPTRSLVRARRCLAGLPGGGGTPLASGIDAARSLAQAVARQGGTPLLVLLTDGKANVARDGRPGRPAAQAEATAAARAWRSTGLGALLLDTAPEPQAQAQALAREMQARYVALPHADSRTLARVVAEHHGLSS